MDRSLIGYQAAMTDQRIFRAASILLVAGTMSFGIAACGSDDNGSDGNTATTGSRSGGEVTPDKKAPESAGDKANNAPDDVISDKPGGSVKPASP